MKVLRCGECGSYTLGERCPACGGESVSPKPARFSPEDRYGRYRRMLKRDQFEH